MEVGKKLVTELVAAQTDLKNNDTAAALKALKTASELNDSATKRMPYVTGVGKSVQRQGQAVDERWSHLRQ